MEAHHIEQATKDMVTELDNYRQLVEVVNTINAHVDTSPEEHKSIWERIRLERFGELDQFVQDSNQLPELFVGALVEEETTTDFSALETSLEGLRKFLIPEEVEAVEVKTVKTVATKTVAAQISQEEARDFVSLFSQAKERGGGIEFSWHNNPEKAVIDGRTLDVFERSAYSRAALDLLVRRLSLQIKEGVGDSVSLVALVKLVKTDPQALALFTKPARGSNQRNDDNTTISARIGSGIQSVNNACRASGFPKLVLGFGRGAPDNYYRINPAYKLVIEAAEEEE